MDNPAFGTIPGICHYQIDRSLSVPYDKEYWDKYIGYEKTEIAKKINHFRTSITTSYCNCILDIGIGSGEFIKNSNIKVFGYDINPYAVEFLKEMNLFVDPYIFIPEEIEGFSMWDVIEHLPEPDLLLNKLKGHLFVSLPVFDLDQAQQSKHFRPNEHYWLWSAEGFVKWMNQRNWLLLETDDAETRAGREDIMSFVFKKD